MNEEPAWGTKDQDEPSPITWHLHQWSKWKQVECKTVLRTRLLQKKTCSVCNLTKLRSRYTK